MNINISTTYEIGDILYLEQPTGGLRKVIIQDVVVSLNHRMVVFVLNRRVSGASENGFITCLSNRLSEKDIIRNIKYWRRGNNWLTEKPIRKRKPMTEVSYRKWLKVTGNTNIRYSIIDGKIFTAEHTDE